MPLLKSIKCQINFGKQISDFFDWGVLRMSYSCKPYYIDDLFYSHIPNCTNIEQIIELNKVLDVDNTFSAFKEFHDKPCANFALTYQKKIKVFCLISNHKLIFWFRRKVRRLTTRPLREGRSSFTTSSWTCGWPSSQTSWSWSARRELISSGLLGPRWADTLECSSASPSCRFRQLY